MSHYPDLLELLTTPATDEPLAAGLLFAAGALIGWGGVMVASNAMKESLRRKEGERECCR